MLLSTISDTYAKMGNHDAAGQFVISLLFVVLLEHFDRSQGTKIIFLFLVCQEKGYWYFIGLNGPEYRVCLQQGQQDHISSDFSLIQAS